jgi:hypothetical protein
MKKPGNKMVHPLMAITTSLFDFRMLKNLAEKLAFRRYDSDYSPEKVQTGWQAIKISSIEADVNGCINFSSETDFFNRLFAGRFLFTCTEETGRENSLTWVNSLS